MGEILNGLRAQMAWKDYVAGAVSILTLATVLIQGGRMIERQEAGNAKLLELTGQVTQLRTELAQAQLALAAQIGTDRLHDEQIRVLRRDVDIISGRK